MSYEDFERIHDQDEDNIYFKEQLERQEYFLVSRKLALRQVMDERIDKMVTKPGFFREVIDFSKLIATSAADPNTDTEELLQHSILWRSIGYRQSLTFM